ncbi:MAG: T9SS type A sorting domain-containing protein [Bacteroidetes bacterium]|nr:T9SS type A sorting domain-containing protein [Bacteroidota bacterium]
MKDTIYLKLFGLGLLLLFSKFSFAQIRYVEVNIEQAGLYDCLTSVEELKQEKISSIKVFPNPGKGIFSIKAKGFETEMSISVSAYNITYVEVLNQDYNFLPSNKIIKIDLSFLPKGMYLIKLSNKKQYATTRLIIL